MEYERLQKAFEMISSVSKVLKAVKGGERLQKAAKGYTSNHEMKEEDKKIHHSELVYYILDTRLNLVDLSPVENIVILSCR